MGQYSIGFRFQILLFSIFLGILNSCTRQEDSGSQVKIDSDFQKRTQEALINAKAGAVIELPAGKFYLDKTLSLTVPNVTIRGKGIDKTVLSFKGQKVGAEGILATADGFTVEDLAVEDTKGDGIKVQGANGVTFRRVRAEWTRGPNASNGGYGLYPVQSKNILIEDCVAKGAADSGIYVGQSKNIIVRRNKAIQNVAGIEIENSQDADVYENEATQNTGGILVFNLPDLPVQDGKNTRVFKNIISNNNTENFAPKGNIVAMVPAGTGFMVMANGKTEIFQNTIQKNGTVNVAVVSYFVTDIEIKDARYKPYVEEIDFHDNQISEGGDNPQGVLVKALAFVIGKPLPDILYDGMMDPKADPKKPALCIKDNGAVRFLNFDVKNNFKNRNADIGPHLCRLSPLPPVQLQLAKADPKK